MSMSTPRLATSSLHRSPSHVIAATLALGLLACGGADPAEGGGDDDGIGGGDITAPLITATVPADGATGVASDTAIVITFSEPMDHASVEAAYASPDLPASAVGFDWNAAGDTLTITPLDGLVYAEGEGTDPAAVPARLYTITIGSAAVDLAGNPIGGPLELSFATRRRMTASFGLDNAMSRSRTSADQILGANLDFSLGDGLNNAYVRAFLTFDLTALPLGAAVESATLSAGQMKPVGTPYELGSLTATHVLFGTMDDTATPDLLAAMGDFSTDASPVTKSLDVSAAVLDDIANREARAHRSQYLLAFAQATDGDGAIDRAVFSRATFAVKIVYLVD